MTNTGRPDTAGILCYISWALVVAHPEQFPDPVVLIGETISLFFSQLNLVGIFTHHFFVLKIFVESRALSASLPLE